MRGSTNGYADTNANSNRNADANAHGNSDSDPNTDSGRRQRNDQRAGGSGQFQHSSGDYQTHKKGKAKVTGSFSYNDPAVPLTISANKITNATITGNQSSFSGTAKGSGKHAKKVSFTVNVTDNGSPGTNDTFSISVSTGYSASGNPTSGDIRIH